MVIIELNEFLTVKSVLIGIHSLKRFLCIRMRVKTQQLIFFLSGHLFCDDFTRSLKFHVTTERVQNGTCAKVLRDDIISS